jgi:glutathione S-transferase
MPLESKRPISVEEARTAPGLRLAVLRGVPSPWSQAAKGIFHVKHLDYSLVHRSKDDSPDALEEWTGQASFPAAMLDDERPRTGWAEILLLAEELAPEPPLLPADAGERALCIGLCHELCGEMGLGWCRRLESIHTGMQQDPPSPVGSYLGGRYGYSKFYAAQAKGRVRDVVRLLTQRLEDERKQGNRFLMGPSLTALDIYWATYCNIVSPLPPDQLPIPDSMRPIFTSPDEELGKLLEQGLLEHRDFIYQEYLELPVVL